jgi:3-hydroxyacyl-[acyl-carrier-protein] dehydratase
MYEEVYGIEEITKTLMHRYPFLLIDRIVEFEDNKRLVAIKNVTFNEPFFQGHFPDRPVMPGVLIVEAMAQASAFLAKRSSNGAAEDAAIFLVGLDKFKFKRVVRPGDTLVISLKDPRKKRTLWVMEGEVRVNGDLVASGVLSAMETA